MCHLIGLHKTENPSNLLLKSSWCNNYYQIMLLRLSPYIAIRRRRVNEMKKPIWAIKMCRIRLQPFSLECMSSGSWEREWVRERGRKGREREEGGRGGERERERWRFRLGVCVCVCVCVCMHACVRAHVCVFPWHVAISSRRRRRRRGDGVRERIYRSTVCTVVVASLTRSTSAT